MGFELTNAQLMKVADIFADIGQVCLASIVVPFLFDVHEPQAAIIGFLFACVCWVGSVSLLRKGPL